MSSVTTSPPGLVTRRISASPRARSPRLRTRNADVTAANARSRNGSASASAASSGTRVAARRASLERANRQPADPVEASEGEHKAEHAERRGRERVTDSRDAQRHRHTEARRHGVQAVRAVKVDVLARVDDVKARDPYREREPEHED